MAKQAQLPAIPNTGNPALQTYLQGLHEYLSASAAPVVAPNLPTGLIVTPIAGGNVVQFTRSNAATYQVYMANTADRSTASQVGIGTSNSYTDNVGVGAQIRFYWIEGFSQNGVSSGVTSPRSGTTLALGTPNPVIPIPAQSFARVFDTTIDRTRPVIATTDPNVAGQPAGPVQE